MQYIYYAQYVWSLSVQNTSVSLLTIKIHCSFFKKDALEIISFQLHVPKHSQYQSLFPHFIGQKANANE